MKISKHTHARIQRRGHGGRPHLENHNAIGFLSITGPKPLKNCKATKTAFNVGPSSARPLAKLFGSAHDVVHHLMFIFL